MVADDAHPERALDGEQSRVPWPREFRLAGEYRRCGWYALLGALVVIGARALLDAWQLLPPIPDATSPFLVSLIPISLAIGLLVLVYRWRLRVDEIGVARRRFSRWDMWSWEEFQTGKIECYGTGFQSAERPWWRNKLTFDLLKEDEKRFAQEVCRIFFRPTPTKPETLADAEIVVRCQLFNRITFRADGFEWRSLRGELNFGWSELTEARFVVSEHWSGELRRIELVVPNQTIRIQGVCGVEGRGKHSERIHNPRVIPRIVREFLERHIPAKKIVREAIRGAPETLRECTERRNKLQREQNWMTWLSWTFPWICSLLFAFECLPKGITTFRDFMRFEKPGWAAVVVVTTLATIVAMPIVTWAFLREIRNRNAEVIQELDEWEKEQLSGSLQRMSAGRVEPG